MVARAGGDDAAGECFFGQLRHFVVRAADFEGKHGLQVFAFEQDVVVQTTRQPDCGFERGFDGNVVNGGGQDADEVIGIRWAVVHGFVCRRIIFEKSVRRPRQTLSTKRRKGKTIPARSSEIKKNLSKAKMRRYNDSLLRQTARRGCFYFYFRTTFQ